MTMLRTILGMVLFCMAVQAGAAAPTFPDRNRSAVVDAAGVIPDKAEASLNAEIVAWNRSTGHQLVVATVPSLQGHSIQDYGNRLLGHWGLGRAGINDGALLLLAPNEREVRIEVGYGLEPAVTDALSGAIIRETIRPALQSGDVAGALGGGARRIMQATAAEAGVGKGTKGASGQSDPPFPLGFFTTIGLAILGIGLLIWGTRRRKNVHQRTRDERRYATVTRAESRTGSAGRSSRRRGDTDSSAPLSTASSDPLLWLQQRAHSHESSSSYSGGGGSWDSSSSSSSSSDSGFDSGGGASGGGGADSNY